MNFFLRGCKVQDAHPHPHSHEREAPPLSHLQQELLAPGEPQDPQPLTHRSVEEPYRDSCLNKMLICVEVKLNSQHLAHFFPCR